MAEQSDVLTVPARRGRAARLNQGQAIKIINTHGQQVVDFWAFNAADLGEFLSMEHLRATIEGIFPHAGDDLVTNRRRPILHFEADTTPGRHDTLMAACDVYRYQLLGCEGYHDNCTDNMFEAMRTFDLAPGECPSPLNLFMNIPVGPDGKTQWGSPLCKPGDYVVLRAEMDCVAVMSTCPQDMTPVNGPDQTPTEVHFQILS